MKKFKRLLTLFLAFMMLSVFALDAYAWSYMSHVNSANILLMETLSKPAYSGGRNPQKNLEIANLTDGTTWEYTMPAEFNRAIREYPAAFRTGALGPDFYPDMVIGQAWIHPYDTDATVGSGEWLSLLVDAVNSMPQYSGDRLEALSFTLGYMLHYCGDMFGHDFVNMFSGGTFPNLTDVDYLDSKNPELNNVLSHMAIEAQMDKFVNAAFYSKSDMLDIEAPTRFVTDTLLVDGNIASGVADLYYLFETDDSLLGGIPVYLDVMVSFRNNVMKVADKFRPNTELITMGISSYADQWALDLDAAIYGLVDTFDMIARRLVTGENNPAIEEDTLHDWIFEGYPIKEMLKERLDLDKIDKDNGTVNIILEELSLWWDTYALKALGVPDVFVDGLPEWLDYILQVFTWPIDIAVAALKTALSAIFAEIIVAAVGTEVGLLIGQFEAFKSRLEVPEVQLDHADNAYQPAEDNSAELMKYLSDYLDEQKLLAGKTAASLIKNSDGKNVLDQLVDSDFDAFYNTMVMFKLILMGPDNFTKLLEEFGLSSQNQIAYTTQTAELKATTLRLDVKTIDQQYSGTDDNVYAAVFRASEKGSLLEQIASKLLDNSLNNDLECGDLNTFYIDLPIEMPLDEIEIVVAQSGTATANGGWACESITVTPMRAGVELTDPIGVGGNLYMDAGKIWNLQFQKALKFAMNPVVNENTPVTHVELRIKTGNGDYLSGTDYDVYVGAADTKQSNFSEKVILDRYLINDFENGDDTTYMVPLAEYDQKAQKTIHSTLGSLALTLLHDSNYDWYVKNVTMTPYNGTMALTEPIDFGGKEFNSSSDFMLITPSLEMSAGKVTYKTYSPLKLTYQSSLDDGLLENMQSLDAGVQWKYLPILWNTKQGRRLFFKIFKGFEPEIELWHTPRIEEDGTFEMKLLFTGVWNGIDEERRNAQAEYAKNTFGDTTYEKMPAVDGQVAVFFRNSSTGKADNPQVVTISNNTAKITKTGLAAGIYDLVVYYTGEGAANQYYSDTEVIYERSLVVTEPVEGFDSYGQINEVVISGLDAPYHNSELDRTATVSDYVVLNKIQYTMFQKELDSFKRGDTVGIGVRVNPKDPNVRFTKEGRAYWADLDVYSDKTLLISPTEAVYVFNYYVDALESQVINTADLWVDEPVAGERVADAFASSMTEGLKVGTVTWTPDDTEFREGVEYTAKITFSADDDHVLTDNFMENGTATVNGNAAKLVHERLAGRFYRNYIEFTFPAIPEKDPNFKLEAVGNTEIQLSEADKAFTLKVKVSDTEGKNADFQWFRCDEYGKTDPEYPLPLSMGDTLTVNAGIPADKMLETQYYRAYASIGNTVRAVTFAVTLIPEKAVDDPASYEYKIEAVGDTEVQLYESDKAFTLNVKVTDNGEINADFQWYRCDENGTKLTAYPHPLSMGDTLTVTAGIPADEMLETRYYRADACIGNTVKSVVFSVTLCPMGVEGEDPAVPDFKIEAVGDTEVRLYEADKAFTLKAKVTNNGETNADFQWYRCDENGTKLTAYPHPLSMGDTLTVTAGIPAEEMLETRYYRADACIGNTVKSVLFSVTLCPMGVEEEYVFPFTDVKSSDWYYSYVEAAHQMGLINGTSDTTYSPNTELTVAAAVKLAVCMNILYNGGNPNTDISVGKDVWYSTYMKYALDHGIIDSDLSSRQGETITRSEYVYIFSKALPAEAFAEINNIPVGSIPDVPNCNTAEEKAIYKFYRAGIVLGTDDKGTFKPNSNISRAEVATILVRMMDPSFRVKK